MEQRLDDLERQYHTLERRVSNIERLERESNFTLRDVAHKATIILGCTTVTSEEITEVKTNIDSIEKRLSTANTRLDDIDGRLSVLEDKFDTVHSAVKNAQEDITKMYNAVKNAQEDMEDIKTNMTQILALLTPKR
jgi:chromosome segregation ATPase